MNLNGPRSRLRCLLLLLSVAATACSSGDDDAQTSSGTTGEPGSCAELSDCAACLAVAGCNWSGMECGDSCLADAACYGPENPAAPTCPECGGLGDSCSVAECCGGLVCDGALVPTCVDPDVCLPDGAQCDSNEECCEGSVCDGEEVLQCTPAEDAGTSGGPACAEVAVNCDPSADDCCAGLECHGSLIPVCVAPNMCLPDGAECTSSDACCEGSVCDGEEVLVCQTIQ